MALPEWMEKIRENSDKHPIHDMTKPELFDHVQNMLRYASHLYGFFNDFSHTMGEELYEALQMGKIEYPEEEDQNQIYREMIEDMRTRNSEMLDAMSDMVEILYEWKRLVDIDMGPEYEYVSIGGSKIDELRKHVSVLYDAIDIFFRGYLNIMEPDSEESLWPYISTSELDGKVEDIKSRFENLHI